MSSVVVTENLVQRFGSRTVLDRLTFEVPEGAIYAFVGPNGAGKTTTIKTLLNLLHPASGRAEVLGKPTRRLAPRDFTDIGLVSESARLPLWMTVRYFLDYLKPFYPRWDDALAAQLLAQFDLPSDRPLKHLSRGMRMKAALVSVLSFHPRLLFLDEPFSGLDPLVRDDLTQGLLARAEEMTIFISSHDLSEIESFSSHAGYLEEGRLKFSEEMSSLVNRFREVEVTLAKPPALPPSWPAAWLQPESAASVVRFIDSAHDPGRTEAEIRRVFPYAQSIDARPMSLRAIFVALARTARKAA